MIVAALPLPSGPTAALTLTVAEYLITIAAPVSDYDFVVQIRDFEGERDIVQDIEIFIRDACKMAVDEI